MAVRKFTFINQVEGYHEEVANTDEATLGKLTFTGVGGYAIDAGSQKIGNTAAPTLPEDVANKAYVDAVASGLTVHTSVRLTTAAALSANTAAGAGIGKTLTADANGALSIDGVAVVNGDRVLVKDEVTGEDNGVYVVTDAGSAGTPYVLTRATDLDTNSTGEVQQGAFVFTTEGGTNTNTGWTLTTVDPITVDTTSQTWTQFSGAPSFTYDQGLKKLVSSIQVDLDTAAAAQTAGAGGGSSGLEFDANTAGGKLRAAVNATGGLERSASGLAAKLNGTTLQSGGSGLSVKGLPSLFEINGVATGATVTAANLGTLTNGSNADALHVHATAAATEAPKVENTLIADEAIAVGDPVAFSTTVNDRLVKGLASSDAKSRIIAVARTAAASQGDPLEAVTAGPCTGVLSGATVGTPYYLQAAGGVGTTLPSAGSRLMQVGIAKNATDLFVRIIDFGKKAA